MPGVETGPINLSKFLGRFVSAAAAIGMLAGLAEGIAKVIAWLAGVPKPMGLPILWVTPVFYGLLTIAAALGIAPLLVLLRIGTRKFAPATGTHDVALRGAQWFLVALAAFGTWNLARSLEVYAFAAFILSAGVTFQAGRLLLRKEGLERLARWAPYCAGGALGLWLAVTGGHWWTERSAVSRLPAPRRDAPNVLLLTLDTLRADHLSCYGYARKTPTLDRLAGQGTQFDFAVSPSSWTLPSHASLFTGKHVFEHRAEMTTGGRLDRRYPMLAEKFRDEGYLTGAFVANVHVCPANFGFGRGFVHYDDLFWGLEDSLWWTQLGEQLGWRVRNSQRFGWHQWGRKQAGDLNRQFLSWLPQSTERPFFAWLNYFDPHDPYFAPPPFQTAYGRSPAAGNPGSFGNYGACDWHGHVSPEEARRNLDAYDCAVAYLDAELGKLFDELDRRGLLDNTIVVITSDHGESFGEHGLSGHANAVYRETLHVPLIFHFPPAVAAGVRVPQAVSLCDVPATVCSLAGIADQGKFPGRSLLNDPPVDGAPILSELFQNPYHPETHPVTQGDMISITTTSWHAILQDGRRELYAHDDSTEDRDLADTPQGRQVLDQLRGALAKQLKGTDAARWSEVLRADLLRLDEPLAGPVPPR